MFARYCHIVTYIHLASNCKSIVYCKYIGQYICNILSLFQSSKKIQSINSIYLQYKLLANKLDNIKYCILQMYWTIYLQYIVCFPRLIKSKFKTQFIRNIKCFILQIYWTIYLQYIVSFHEFKQIQSPNPTYLQYKISYIASISDNIKYCILQIYWTIYLQYIVSFQS